jgi:hypothetical protein
MMGESVWELVMVSSSGAVQERACGGAVRVRARAKIRTGVKDPDVVQRARLLAARRQVAPPVHRDVRRVLVPNNMREREAHEQEPPARSYCWRQRSDSALVPR